MITLTELLIAYEIDRKMERAERDHQGLTASSFNSCTRRAAYVMHDQPVTDTQPLVTVATVGQLLHDAIAALWVEQGYQVEQTGAHGTLDAISETRKELRDLKSVSRNRFDRWVKQGGPPESVWKQTMTYGHDRGADEEWLIVVDVICRETGRSTSFVANYDPDYAAKVIVELEDTEADISQQIPPRPDDRFGRGDPVCDNCPFLTACWGADESEHPVFDDAEIERFAAEYLEAREIKAEAEKRMKVAKARLHGAEGDYGTTHIHWKEMPGKTVSYTSKPYKQIDVSIREPEVVTE